LQFSAHKKIEFLVGTAELDISLNSNRVICLKQWIKEFCHRDRLPVAVPLAEIVSGKQLGYGEPAGKVYDIGEREFVKPFALPPDLRPIPVHYIEELLHIGPGIGFHFFCRKHGSGDGNTAGIADAGSPVTNYKNNPVANILELAQLFKTDHMPQVDIGEAGVKTFFKAKLLTRIKQLQQLIFGYNLSYASF